MNIEAFVNIVLLHNNATADAILITVTCFDVVVPTRSFHLGALRNLCFIDPIVDWMVVHVFELRQPSFDASLDQATCQSCHHTSQTSVQSDTSTLGRLCLAVLVDPSRSPVGRIRHALLSIAPPRMCPASLMCHCRQTTAFKQGFELVCLNFHHREVSCWDGTFSVQPGQVPLVQKNLKLHPSKVAPELALHPSHSQFLTEVQEF